MIGQSMTWIASDGGPHLLLPAEAVERWRPHIQQRQSVVSTAGRNFTYYESACSIASQTNIGPIEVDGITGVVLGGDEVPLSTWIPFRNGIGGYVVIALEWSSNPTDDDLQMSVHHLPNVAFQSNDFALTTSREGLVLFAASDSPINWVYRHLKIAVPAGQYAIDSAECDVDQYALLRIHRFTFVATR